MPDDLTEEVELKAFQRKFWIDFPRLDLNVCLCEYPKSGFSTKSVVGDLYQTKGKSAKEKIYGKIVVKKRKFIMRVMYVWGWLIDFVNKQFMQNAISMKLSLQNESSDPMVKN